MPFPLTLPAEGEFASYWARYIDTVVGTDLRQVLAEQPDILHAACSGLSESGALHRYSEGKWSVKEVIGHVADTERVFSYRALCIARGDTTPLPAFDVNDWVAAANFDRRPIGDLIDDFETVRRQTLSLLTGLDAESWSRTGTVSRQTVSARALFYITAGHARHHLRLLASDYGLPISASQLGERSAGTSAQGTSTEGLHGTNDG